MTNTKEDKMVGTAVPNNAGQGFEVEIPNGLGVVYTDVIHMARSEYGVVFDFGQRMGPTNKVNIVSRVGMSREHAEALLNMMEKELKKK